MTAQEPQTDEPMATWEEIASDRLSQIIELTERAEQAERDIAALTAKVAIYERLVESIQWVPLDSDDDGPAEFAVADPSAYREARAALKDTDEIRAEDDRGLR